MTITAQPVLLLLASTIAVLSLFGLQVALAHAQSLPDGHSHPHVLHHPHRGSSDHALKYGQSACTDLRGDLAVIGANGYQDHRGAIFVYNASHLAVPSTTAKTTTTTTTAPKRYARWTSIKPILVSPTSLQKAEERPEKELRPHAGGSGFGFSCACSTSSLLPTIVVGAPGHDMQRGVIYILHPEQHASSSSSSSAGSVSTAKHHRPSAWIETARLDLNSAVNSDDNGHYNRHRIRQERRNGDNFGWDVAVDAMCTLIIASARGRRANNGEVILFQCRESCRNCKQVQQFTPPDHTDGAGPGGIRIRNNFGTAVAMAASGTVLAIGATGYNMERGAVYVYGRNASTGLYDLLQRLQSPNAEPAGFFGFKVSVDARGATVAVGADGEAGYTGAVYVFERDVNDATVWTTLGSSSDSSGSSSSSSITSSSSSSSSATDSDSTSSSSSTSSSGTCSSTSCSIGSSSSSSRNSTTGTEEDKFHLAAELHRDDDTGDPEDNFGGSLALSADGNVLAVGAPGASHGKLNDHGVLMLYERLRSTGGGDSSKWKVRKQTWLPSSHSRKDTLFAWAVALSGDGSTVFATAPDWEKSTGLAAVEKFDPHAPMSERWYRDVTSSSLTAAAAFYDDDEGKNDEHNDGDDLGVSRKEEL